MTFFDQFDAVYCITLPHRADRRVHAEAEFSRIGLLPRVEWVDGVLWYPGHFGCTASHRKVWQIALESGHKQVLVFEDDLVAHDRQVAWLEIEPVPPEGWGILNLGGFWDNRSKVREVRSRWLAVTNVWSTGALALTAVTMARLLAGIPELRRGTLREYRAVNHIDWFLGKDGDRYNTWHPAFLPFSQSDDLPSNVANHPPSKRMQERFHQHSGVKP